MAGKSATRKSPATKKGLSVKTFSGLSKKRIEKKRGGNGIRLSLKPGAINPVQFLTTPEDSSGFVEYDCHIFRDESWNFVPCLGDGCPLCDSEDDDQRSTSYRFVCSVYDLKGKRVRVLEGGQDLAGRIFYRYERNKKKFLSRVFEVVRFDTKPVSYEVSVADDGEPVKTAKLKLLDLEEFLEKEAKRYFGDELPDVSAMESDDDDEDDDDEDDDSDDDEDSDDDDEDDDEDEEDEDSDDDDDDSDEDDEDDDEDEEPAPKKAKKAPAKKPAKKAAPKKAVKSRR